MRECRELVDKRAKLSQFDDLFKAAKSRAVYYSYSDLPAWLQANLDRREIEDGDIIHIFHYSSSFGFKVVFVEIGHSGEPRQVQMF